MFVHGRANTTSSIELLLGSSSHFQFSHTVLYLLICMSIFCSEKVTRINVEEIESNQISLGIVNEIPNLNALPRIKYCLNPPFNISFLEVISTWRTNFHYIAGFWNRRWVWATLPTWRRWDCHIQDTLGSFPHSYQLANIHLMMKKKAH